MTTAYKIHIPVAFNDGKLVPQVTIDEFLAQTISLFGGYSFNPTPILGGWREGTQDYVEGMYALEIATDDFVLLMRHVERMRAVFKQKCMYVVTLGPVNFV